MLYYVYITTVYSFYENKIILYCEYYYSTLYCHHYHGQSDCVRAV